MYGAHGERQGVKPHGVKRGGACTMCRLETSGASWDMHVWWWCEGRARHR